MEENASCGTQFREKAKACSENTELLLEMIAYYGIDGVIFHACRSCRATTIGQINSKNQLSKFSNFPMMQLVSDMVDLRLFGGTGRHRSGSLLKLWRAVTNKL